MRKIALGIILIVFVMAGCATQNKAPVMPKFETQAGKVCARGCQQTYSQCNMACGDVVGKNYAIEKQRQRCLNNCNQLLEDCYLSCE